MDPTPVTFPSASAAPDAPAPTPTTAVEAALSTKSTSDYRAARRAERAGTPLEPPPTDPAPDPSPDPDPAPAPLVAIGTDPKKPTRAEREQERINKTIRDGIEAANAPLRAELERLRAAAPPIAPDPPVAKVPDYKRIMALPGAPKLADFDSVEEHGYAAAAFVDQIRSEERATAARQHDAVEQMTAAETQRIDRFVGQLQETKAADPTFVAKLSPEVKALKPFGGLMPGEVGGPTNIVAEQLYDSPIAPAVAVELSKPGVLAALTALPPQIAAIRDPQQRIRAHTQHIVKAFSRLEGRLSATAAAPDVPDLKTVSDMDAPPLTVGSRPGRPANALDTALANKDTGAYRRLKREERAAKFGRR